MKNNGNNVIQIGSGPGTYWINDGVWGAAALTLGTYTGENGTTFEQAAGVSPNLGPNGEISWRMTWKWPVGTTEVKSYPSAIIGNKPGCSNTWRTPCGWDVKLPDGSDAGGGYPSGPTPGSIFPMQLPIAPLYSSFDYKHNATPTGQGHLAYDIWLQNTPTQCHGFNNCQEITHEIMIPLNYWGGYGAYPARNPGWYYKDEMIDGRLWHIYISKNGDGTFTESFFGGWKFIVFEPDGPVAAWHPGSVQVHQLRDHAEGLGRHALGDQRAFGQRGAGHRAGRRHRRHDGEQLPGLEVSRPRPRESALRGAFLLALQPSFLLLQFLHD